MLRRDHAVRGQDNRVRGQRGALRRRRRGAHRAEGGRGDAHGRGGQGHTAAARGSGRRDLRRARAGDYLLGRHPSDRRCGRPHLEAHAQRRTFRARGHARHRGAERSLGRDLRPGVQPGFHREPARTGLSPLRGHAEFRAAAGPGDSRHPIQGRGPQAGDRGPFGHCQDGHRGGPGPHGHGRPSGGREDLRVLALPRDRHHQGRRRAGPRRRQELLRTVHEPEAPWGERAGAIPPSRPTSLAGAITTWPSRSSSRRLSSP